MGRAVEVVFIDNASIGFRYTDREPNGMEIQPTLTAAKRWALMTARVNRDAWAACVRSITETRVGDLGEDV